MHLRHRLVATISVLLATAAPAGLNAQGASGGASAPSDVRDRSPHAERFVTVDGARLQVLDWGGRGPVLLFLPGFGTGAHVFDDLAPAFTDRFRVLALTPRGFPPSSAPDSGYIIAQLAADVRGVLDSLGAARAVLAGHSIAGAVISRFAEAYPDRLRAAVYLDAAFDYGPAYRAWRARPFGAPAPADTTPAFRAWVRRYAVDETALETDARQIERLDSADFSRRRALLEPLAAEVRSRPHDLSHVRAPALAICAVGSLDRYYGWLTPDSARYAAAKAYIDGVSRPLQRGACAHFRRTVPHARALELESGHFVFVDRREAVARAMRSFLRGVR